MSFYPHEHYFVGLDGSHLLSFLAALGTLRSATRAWPAAEPTLRWEISEGRWRPIVAIPGVTDRRRLLEGLEAQLKVMSGHSALAIGDDLNFKPEEFRGYAETAQAQVGSDPTAAVFLNAFSCEAVLDNKGIWVADTAFRTMRGAGHQHFVKTMRELVEATERDHLEMSLFRLWRYADTKFSLRWDPQDDRRYALRWNNPSDESTQSERGANRMAVEALPIFPVQPVGRRLETTGFRHCTRQTYFSWPIWEQAIPLDVVGSLVALRELQSEVPPRKELAARGIVEVYRCQRITLGKFRNFTTAVPV